MIEPIYVLYDCHSVEFVLHVRSETTHTVISLQHEQAVELIKGFGLVVIYESALFTHFSVK